MILCGGASDDQVGNYKIEKRQKRINRNSWPSLCSFRDEHVFVIGGRRSKYDPNDLHHNSVECYNLHADSWMLLPNLHKARAGAGSCQFKDCVFVFCGVIEARVRLNSIERLRVIKSDQNSIQVEQNWTLIQLD